MRSISIKEFQKNIYAQLKATPFVINKDGAPTYIVDKVATKEPEKVATNPVSFTPEPFKATNSLSDLKDKIKKIENHEDYKEASPNMCELCAKPVPSIGKFDFWVYEDTDQGAYEAEMYLCEYHRKLRKAEPIEDET
jgi:hypothetical protein